MYAILRIMTETPESTIEPTTATGQLQYDDRYGARSRLGQVAAWVLIIAGAVFVVAVIFFSGLVLGWSSGGHDGWHRGYSGRRYLPDDGELRRHDGTRHDGTRHDGTRRNGSWRTDGTSANTCDYGAAHAAPLARVWTE